MNTLKTNDRPPNSQRADRIQHPPIGPEPVNASLFLCAVMRCSVATMGRLRKCVYADDLDEPAASVYRTALDLAARDVPPSPALIREELRSRGELTRPTELWIINAVTAGAERMAIRQYAGNVVADRLRALYASLGQALSTDAEYVAEPRLADNAEHAAKQIRSVQDRLDALRGQ